jgi:hypothetical protein
LVTPDWVGDGFGAADECGFELGAGGAARAAIPSLPTTSVTFETLDERCRAAPGT